MQLWKILIFVFLCASCGTMIKIQLTRPSDRPFNLGCTFMRRLNHESVCVCLCVCGVKSTCILVTMKSIKWVDETERRAQKQTDRCWQIIVKKTSLNYSSLKKASIIEPQRSLGVLLARANKLRPGVLELNELNRCSHGSMRKQKHKIGYFLGFYGC